MPEIKIASEVAEIEFERFTDIWDIDSDVETMDEDDRQGFENQKRRLVRHIRSGRLTVGDDAELHYGLIDCTMESLTDLTFRIPRGNALLDWDKFKERQSMHKLNTFMGSMCGVSPAIFSKMDVRDLKVCQAVATLFLGS